MRETSERDQIQDLVDAWRLILGGALGQVIGGVLALSFSIADSPFNSLTTGLALGTPFGTALGWVWHKIALAKPLAQWVIRLAVIGAVALPLFTLVDGWLGASK